MAVSGEPPPKRTRTDVIAQSNAHLQYLYKRKNRWMTAATGDSDNPPAAGQAPPPTAIRTNETPSNVSACTTNPPPAASPLVRNLDEDEELGKETQDAPALHSSEARAKQEARQEPRATSQPRMQPQSAPHLVHYESPKMVDSATELSTLRVAAPKSMDRTAGAAPSLPSPAPSDENTNSPTLAEHQIAAMRNRTAQPPRISTDLDNNSGAHAPGFPLGMQFPGCPPQHLRHISMPQDSQVPQAMPLPNQQPGQQFLSMQQPMHALHSPHWRSPLQGQHQRGSTQGNAQVPNPRASIVQSNMQPVQTAPVVTSNLAHPYPSQAVQIGRPLASRIGKDTLLTRLKEKQEELGHVLTGYDKGRLVLLRSAVEHEDWFYQVLSQVFCLRSVMPSLLPQSLKSLPTSSWEHLGNLLCPNTEINNDLLGFFAEFPEPIMDLYSDLSNARDIYEFRAGLVKTFLIALPQYWGVLAHKSREMLAPPLVEDMIAKLHLHSIVLQTTCFRAFMRAFWGPEDSQGTQAVEALHHLDQQTYYGNCWRRNPQEKLEAYAALRRAFEVWNEYEQSQLQSWSGNVHRAQDPFVLPNDVQLFFRTMPKSRQQQFQQSQSRPSQGQVQSPDQRILHQRWRQTQAKQSLRNRNSIAGQPPTLLSPGSLPHLQLGPRNRRLPGPPNVVSPPVLQAGSTTPRQPSRKKKSLFPSLDQCPRAQPTHPDPNRSGLQQAYLRSPVLLPANSGTLGPKLYRHVTGYALPPATIKKRLAVQQAVFEISGVDFGKVARTIPAPIGTGMPVARVVGEDSLMYRLRCCAVPATGFTSESSWVVADNYWPEELCFELNGTQLHTRRKLHHGKHLPIDVTSHVSLGTNKLKILLNRPDGDKRKFDYAVAIETIGVMSHTNIKQNLKRVSTQDSLLAIKKALSGVDEVEDDDIAVTSSNMTVGVVEPLSQARMVELPVRGLNCLHKDVFDLEVFLSVCKRDQPNSPSIVDCWRCPLCRGDVRLHTLIIDEFLMEVRAELGKRELLDTKAIVVESDGSWKPKVEEHTGIRSPSLEHEERASATTHAATPVRPIEVIELD